MFDQTPAKHEGETASLPVYTGQGDLRSTERELPIAQTRFYSKSASRKSDVEQSLSELAHSIRTTTKPNKGELPWLKLARFGDLRTEKGSLRHDANVLAITGIEADYDGPTTGPAVSMDEAVRRLMEAGIRAIVYTSPSHTDAAPRWRVLCPLSREYSPGERDRFVGRLNGLLGGILAAESFTLSQAYYFGSVNSNPSHHVEIVGGTPIDEHDELDATWTGRPATKVSQGNAGQPTGILGPDGERELLEAIRSGDDYHQSCVRLVGRWAFKGVPMMEAYQRLEEAFRGVPEEERDARWEARHSDIGRCVLDIYRKEAFKKDQAPATENPRSAMDVLHSPQGLPLIWMKDMKPRMYAGGTLIKGVLDAGAMSVIYAPSNVGKSFFALDLAFHIASGRDWRGHRVKKPGFVLYLAAEGGQGFINRVEAIKRHYNVPQDADIPLAVVPAGFNLLEADSGDGDLIIKLVTDAVAECGREVVLIVIDTLSRAMAGGDENSARDMTAVVKNIDRIRERVSAHVMIIHHAGKEVARGARGHSSLRAATDTEIEIVRKGEGGDKFAIASVKKQRDMSGENSYPFTLKQIFFGLDEDGDPVTSAVIEPLDDLESTPSKSPSGQAGRALDILHALIREEEIRGALAGPEGATSVAQDRWRCAFYDAHRGDAQDTKRKAFARVLKSLVEERFVGTEDDRVWIINEPQRLSRA